MMTTMAALLGALPLALGFGEGGELRRPLGIAIVGGLIVSQMLTLYTTPVVYLYLDRFRLWAQRRWRRPRPPAVASAAGERRLGAMPDRWRIAPWRCARWRSRGCTVGPDYQRPPAPAPAAYKEPDGWKPAQPARRGERRRVVVGLRRSGARPARAAGRRLEPDPQGRRGRLPRRRSAVVAEARAGLFPDPRPSTPSATARGSPAVGSVAAAAPAAITQN